MVDTTKIHYTPIGGEQTRRLTTNIERREEGSGPSWGWIGLAGLLVVGGLLWQSLPSDGSQRESRIGQELAEPIGERSSSEFRDRPSDDELRVAWWNHDDEIDELELNGIFYNPRPAVPRARINQIMHREGEALKIEGYEAYTIVRITPYLVVLRNPDGQLLRLYQDHHVGMLNRQYDWQLEQDEEALPLHIEFGITFRSTDEVRDRFRQQVETRRQNRGELPSAVELMSMARSLGAEDVEVIEGGELGGGLSVLEPDTPAAGQPSQRGPRGDRSSGDRPAPDEPTRRPALPGGANLPRPGEPPNGGDGPSRGN